MKIALTTFAGSSAFAATSASSSRRVAATIAVASFVSTEIAPRTAAMPVWGGFGSFIVWRSSLGSG